MRVVVSGTHASGKSTLVSDVAMALGYAQLPDPFELVDVDDDPAGAASFGQQLVVAAERLVELPVGSDVVAERGPLDFLAYLAALADLGRRTVAPDLLTALRATTAKAMSHVDLLVVLPLESPDGIRVPDDEDPQLRAAMDERLRDLVDDPDLVGPATRVVEVTGSPSSRMGQVLAAVGPIRIVVAALVRDGRVLLVHRHPSREWYPHCWDLVGGHVEAGESPRGAVIRECFEELGVHVHDPLPIPMTFNDPTLDVHAFLVTRWDGEPLNSAPGEHDDLRWFRPADLVGLELSDPAALSSIVGAVRHATDHRHEEP